MVLRSGVCGVGQSALDKDRQSLLSMWMGALRVEG